MDADPVVKRFWWGVIIFSVVAVALALVLGILGVSLVYWMV
jgi:cytochrome c-type biogenesis protein CcmE